MSANKKKVWKVFWDLQCPFSRKNWELLPSIQANFGDDYDFSIHITSLLFHPQAFTAHCASQLIANKKGMEARQKFIDACYQNQDSYMNAAVGDARKSEVDAIFASIAEKSGILDNSNADDDDGKLTKEEFLAKLQDWDLSIKPAWNEHKEAIALGVVATPKAVIDGVLVEDSESLWGPDEWAEALQTLKKRKADE